MPPKGKKTSEEKKVVKVSKTEMKVATKKDPKPANTTKKVVKPTNKEAVAAEPAAVAAPPGNATAKGKKPTTLKEKILHLLANEEKLIGLPTLKKSLKEKYDIEDSKTNIARINKALKELAEENHPGFGKVNSSYHGGAGSAAYKEYAAEADAKAKHEQYLAEHKDEYQCPFCKTWNKDSTCIGEDSISRGARYRCKKCKKVFFTWIGDCDTNKVGHKTEYKRSGMYF